MGKSDYASYNASSSPIQDLDKKRIAVVKTEWNADILDLLTESCRNTLRDHGIQDEHIHIVEVPGAFELPMGAKMVLSSQLKPDAIVCLGCVIKGETQHDVYINQAVSVSLSQLNLVSGVPVIFGVLTPNTYDQAMARADGTHGDKGKEAAIAALKMISLKEKLSQQSKKISFH